jgi:hypothetical protein
MGLGGIPIIAACRRQRPAALRIAMRPLGGTTMVRILNDLLLFSCVTALVTGFVLAAATLLM